MNSHRHIRSTPSASIITLLALLLLSPFSFAESDSIATMARIVSEMNHFPSDEQKETLAAISKDDSNSEATQTIAEAIRNIEHKPRPEDVSALEEVVGDSSANEEEKQLATIVMDFNHKASPEAQETLKTLLQQKQ